MSNQIESSNKIFLVSFGNSMWIHISWYYMPLMSFSNIDEALDYAVKYVQNCSIHKLNASYVRQQFIQSYTTLDHMFGIKRHFFEYDSTAQPDNVVIIDEIPFKS